MDKKQPEENTEVVKDDNNPKRNYIFQKSGITKTGFWIMIAFLVLLIIGLIASGVLFGSSAEVP